MISKISDLYAFIERATKNRKYAENTANGIKTALKLFEGESNEDEKNSLEKFKDNIDQIKHTIFQKSNSYTAGSIETYKSRILKVLTDYEKYGSDPSKMANWSPTRRERTSKPKDVKQKGTENNQHGVPPSSGQRIDFSIRPSVRCLIETPQDVTEAEIKNLKTIVVSFLDSVVTQK